MTTEITVALIAGSLAYLALVLTKEQKFSEYRKVWVDELRTELSSLLARLHELKMLASFYSASKHLLAGSQTQIIDKCSSSVHEIHMLSEKIKSR